MAIKCKAKNKKGEPCGANAGADGYCFAHSPARAEERAIERKRGGQTKAVRTLKLPDNIELITADDVRVLLIAVMREVANAGPKELRNTIKKADTITKLAAVVFKSYSRNSYNNWTIKSNENRPEDSITVGY